MNYRKSIFWMILLSVIVCVGIIVYFLTDPKNKSYRLRIVVPAGSQGKIVYADQEISPLGNYVIVTSGEGLGETKVALTPVQGRIDTPYDEPAYLMPGIPVRMEAEKGGWFKIGVTMKNDTGEDNIVYVNVKNVEVRMASLTNTSVRWFDYLGSPDEMDWSGSLEIQRPEFSGVTFRWNPEKLEAVNDQGITSLYTGMPIWNAYFCDLTGDGLPELCSTLSFGSGIVDNRIVVYDYANGASYTLEDRMKYDYTLRQNEADGSLWVDKKVYSRDELVASGKLIFAENGLQIADDKDSFFH